MWRIGQNIAKCFSAIFQPLLMPFYSLALLAVYTNFYHMYAGQILRFLIPTLLFTLFIPALFIFVLKKMRYIRDYSLEYAPDRTLPYMIFIISNISLTLFFYNSHVFYWVLGLIAAPVFIAFTGMLINFFWKISAHMLGMGGLIGGILSVCFNVKGSNPMVLFAILFILAGILGVCRLYLRANSAAQVYVGFIIGFVLAYASVFGGLLLMLSYLK
ncbi:hypothetical protein CLV62_11958 [Dysgonomonas alginatilytica]|uniref:PAP2 superfamily protein n=2 Tax=Dysgonomonas alginatilytica TaxID=1605892 RepID=A0A2V3PLI4_9BACT|nr:hypothetical protein CLV62_11958 [Dysgonomonas alginatilytica]